MTTTDSRQPSERVLQYADRLDGRFALWAGPVAARVDEGLARLARDGVVAGLYAKQPSLWSSDPAVQAKIANRLGWLTSPGWVIPSLPRLLQFADGIRAGGFTHTVTSRQTATRGGAIRQRVAPLAFRSTERRPGRCLPSRPPEEHIMRWTQPFAAMLVAAVAQAGDDPAPKPGRYAIDANNDGIVTRDEANAMPRFAGHFDAADKNKDGQLDAAEMKAHREAMHELMRAHAEQRWKTADTDGDGAVSEGEAMVAMPGVAERFNKFDGNGDGKLTRDEMQTSA